MGAEVGVAADHATSQIGAGSDVHVVVAHRALEEGIRLHDHIGAEDGVFAEMCARLDAAAVADHDGSVDARLRADLDVTAEPLALAEPEPADVDADVAVEHVGVRTDVGVERTDVLPVVVGDVAVHRVAGREQRREHVTREVDDLVRRDEVEDVGFEHVDARVDGVGEHLAPRRLLEEPVDAAVRLCDDDAELERVVDVLQGDRGRRARVTVRFDELREVDVGEHVARDHEEGVVELGRGVAHRPGGAERRVLGRVPHRDPEVGAVAEIVADLVGEERDRHDDLVETVQREQRDDVLHHRLVGQRHHRLRRVARERTQPCAFTSGEDHRLHDATLSGVAGWTLLSSSASRAIGRYLIAA